MKEALVGSGAGLLVFLAIIGYNIFPLAFLVFAIAGLLYFYNKNNANGKQFASVGKTKDSIENFSFDSIGGQDRAINELQEALEFLIHPDYVKNMGIRPLKGILLVGPPGTGKTLMAKAAANYTSSSFLATSGSEFIEIYAGLGAKRVRKIFAEARRLACNSKNRSAIIFIDELDILGTKRGTHSSHLEYDQTLNQLLVEMDGISVDENVHILLMGATNRYDMLDPALIRPGRFDRLVQVNLPDKQGRAKILKLHTRNKPVSNLQVIDDISSETYGFSGAHLESLANEAAIIALRENVGTIEKQHFSQAIDKVLLGEIAERQARDEEKVRIAWHESGHALLSELTDPGSVSTLTIVPRGNALGFIRKNLGEDQMIFTQEHLEKQIMVALAGSIAEEVMLGDRSTGAKNDFVQAWSLAQELIESGISKLGIVSAASVPQELLFAECQSIIAAIESKTKDMLKAHINTLERIAKLLLEEETLDRHSFVQCLANVPRAIN